MTLRENFLAILNYRPYTHLPLVRYGHWPETLEKWLREGHISQDEALYCRDGNEFDLKIAKKQGFDFPIAYNMFRPNHWLYPPFEERIIGETLDGKVKKTDAYGNVIFEQEGVSSIPAVADYLLKDQQSFEEHYRFRLQYSDERIDFNMLDELIQSKGDYPTCLDFGSLYGMIRNWMGIEGLSYLVVDDESLLEEIIGLLSDLIYKIAKKIFEYGFRPDTCFFWEDICYNGGALVNPQMFREKVGHHYKKLTDLARFYGVDIVFLDCDGVIDELLPIWLENGVNTMFPIEVGTWGASIQPWRQKYGKELRGIGGANKLVLEQDRDTIDREIERIKPLVDLGGYLPCLDHHITPQTEWDNVLYYCEKMRHTFG